MGSASSTLCDDEIVGQACKCGVQVYAGFKSTERRLVFVHGNKFSAKHKLKTILPSGNQEGDDKTIQCSAGKGLVTFPFEQFLKKEFALEYLKTPYVREKDASYLLSHMWTINVNKDFHEAFTVSNENPAVEHFEPAAVENFVAALVDIFGEEARKEPVKFCTKKTNTVQRVYVGKPAQLLDLLEVDGVKETLGVLSVDRSKNEFVVSTLDKQNRKGTQNFTLGTDPDADQVLYRREGYSSFFMLQAENSFFPRLQIVWFVGCYGGVGLVRLRKCTYLDSVIRGFHSEFSRVQGCTIGQHIGHQGGCALMFTHSVLNSSNRFNRNH